jgi:glycosyltransferase involved in cell wall biosynthesis
MDNKKLSIIIPAFNEAENLTPLYQEITTVAENNKYDYEIIWVNDGSHDQTQSVIEELHKSDPKHVKGIQFRTNYGKAAALHAGFAAATGGIIIQMDADLQDDANEIPRFIEKINSGDDLVVGWKKSRRDSFIKNNSSKVFNWATNAISQVKLHDHNCGFKAYRANVAKELNLYGELHRYIAVLVSSNGYKVGEIAVNHRVRYSGKSKYGITRFVNGYLDLLTVMYITKFRNRPMHLFGYLGLSSFTLGFLIGVYLVLVKYLGHQSIGERPLLLLAVMLMIMGVQITVSGLIGEQINTLLLSKQNIIAIKHII